MQEYLSAGPPLVLTLSVVLAAVAVSAVLVHVVRADRREEKWEREVIERAFGTDDPELHDPAPDDPDDPDDEKRA